MSTWFSERRTVVVLSAVAAIAAAALAFHLVQNRMSLTGGGIAWPKSVWLGCTLLYWFVLPALWVSDARIGAAWHRPFAWLLLLMVLRGVAELWMLYVSHNWSPWYGIAHDASCLVVLWGAAFRAAAIRTSRTSLLHALATGLLFVPEIYFAWYMQAHFRTAGENPLYFVPNEAAHAWVLGVTMAADAAALLYLPGFLYAWLNGKADIHPA